jgi:tripartite-type tricarboxylate transporter receptor subunit TctC
MRRSKVGLTCGECAVAPPAVPCIMPDVQEKESDMGQDRITRRAFSTGAAVSALALPRVARAQAYPNRPVRFILPFAAGGVADVTARLAADKLGEKLGQRFVVENQPGPGGITAGRAIATAAPDGYTIGLLTNGTAISAAIYKALPFDPVKDFAPISALGNFDLVFATNAESQFKSMADVLKAARAEPGKLNIGTIAVGSTQHLGAELLKALAGVNIQIVPFRTTPDVIVGLLRNDIHLMTDFYAAMKSQLTEKKLLGVGTSSLTRTAFLPDVPPVADTVPSYEVASWNGVCVPAGTPAEIVNLINRTLRDILVIPEIKTKYGDFGIEAKASSPEELKARLVSEIKKWSDLIEKAGIAKL